MNCAKCGMSMPAGSGSCPNCGLKIRQPPASSQPNATQPLPPQKGGAPGGAATPPMAGQPGQPFASQSPPNDAFVPGVQPPTSDPFTYSGYISPGEVQPLPPIGGPGAALYKEKSDSSGRMVYLLVGAIVLALAVVGVLYFTVMRKSGPSGPGPEATVQKYFEELSNGNVAGVQALFTPESAPTQNEVLQEMSELITCRGSSAKIVNVELSVSNKTATNANVTVKDITISASGRTAKLSDMGPVPKIEGNVVLINGQWLMN